MVRAGSDSFNTSALSSRRGLAINSRMTWFDAMKERASVSLLSRKGPALLRK